MKVPGELATKRIEDPPLLTGHGHFVADLQAPGMLNMAIYRSPYAHARVRRLNVEAARKLATVFTADDLTETKPIPATEAPQADFAKAVSLEIHETEVRLLAGQRVRYVGEPLAIVLAESRALAEDALELIELEVEPLPAVTGENALTSMPLYETAPNNIAVSLHFERGDRPAAGRAVSGRFRMARQGALPMEGRGALAEPDPHAGRITMWTSTQVPQRVKRSLTTILGWPDDRLRVITPDVGGGFGMKANVAAEEALVAFAADRLGRPVRWIADRAEDLIAAAQARDQLHDITLTVDSQGGIRSLEDDFTVDLGAYSGRAVGIIANSALHAFGPYRVPHISITGRAIVTNKPPSAQYRGAGRPEVCFALERALDLAAAEIGIDGFEIRRRNFIRPDEMPYAQGVPQRDGVPVVYEPSDYPAVLRRALDLAEPADWPDLRRTAEAGGRRFGVGCGAYAEATGRGPSEGARVTIEANGDIAVVTGAASAGQGHATTLAKVCAAVLEVPFERVRVTGGDTDLMPGGVGTFASRTAVVAGNAVHEASLRVREQILGAAADLLRVPPSQLRWDAGAAHAGSQSVALEAVAAAAGPFAAEFHFRPETVTWTMGLHVALVSVDTDSGEVQILRYVSVHDGGPSLDDTIVDAQMQGGITQGIGGAMLEEAAFSADGQPMAITMSDYLVAGSTEAPDIRLGHIFAKGANPLGIKGVGESGCVPPAAALANAIAHALDGARLDSTPFKPERVWSAARSLGR